ncbi:hypothetical protein [Halobacillus litoralis]|uniref:hypothetical protein n=1 Tax=Halobacillus litoralis TaxID=45668 RepID=UPI001CD679D5|nr:hypothetical protein [Halobacillus litoralis]MCA1021911.1 hypothetical protein [Halobacillus litoralis]
MRRKLLVGLFTGVVLLWTTVLVFLLLPSDQGRLPASEHSYSRLEYGVEEKIMKQKDGDEPSLISNQDQPEDILRDIKGTRAWVEDVSEDGRLSIDTLLDHLNAME